MSDRSYEDEAPRGGDESVSALYARGVPLAAVTTWRSPAPRGDSSYAVRLDYGIPVVAFKPVCDCCHSHAATHGAYCHACSVAIEQEQRS